MVVGSDSSNAWRWTPTGGRVNLRTYLTSKGVAGLDGWRLDSAVAVSADGRVVVGMGRNPLGETSAWIAEYPADPERTVIAPDRYEVTRGREVGAYDASKLVRWDGYSVEVEQRVSIAPSVPNAELVALATVPEPLGISGMDFLIVLRSTASPLDDPTCVAEVSAFDWTAGQWISLHRRRPTGEFESITIHGDEELAGRIVDGQGRLSLAVRASHQNPLRLGWRLLVDQVRIVTLR